MNEDYEDDFNEDLADAIRCGDLVECPYTNKIEHCDEDCNNCCDYLDAKVLKRKTIEYRDVDGYLELYINGEFKYRIRKPISIEPFSIKEE